MQVALVLRRLRELQSREASNKLECRRPSPRKPLGEPLLPLDEEAVDMDYGENSIDTRPKPENLDLSFRAETSPGIGVMVNSDGTGPPRRTKPDAETHRKVKQKLSFSETERAPSELSNSSWSEMSIWVIGTNYSLSPLTAAIEQRLILQYLTPLGEYQEVRSSFRFSDQRVTKLHTRVI